MFLNAYQSAKLDVTSCPAEAEDLLVNLWSAIFGWNFENNENNGETMIRFLICVQNVSECAFYNIGFIGGGT